MSHIYARDCQYFIREGMCEILSGKRDCVSHKSGKRCAWYKQDANYASKCPDRLLDPRGLEQVIERCRKDAKEHGVSAN